MEIVESEDDEMAVDLPQPQPNPDIYVADEARFNQPHDPVPRDPAPGQDAVDALRRGARTAPERLRDLWEKWFPGREPGQVEWTGIPNIHALYQSLDVDITHPLTVEMVNAKFKVISSEIADCLNVLDRTGDLRRGTNEAMVRLLLNKIAAARQVLLGSCMLFQSDMMQPSDLPRDDLGLWRFVPPDAAEDEQPNPQQRLRIFALTDGLQSGFRRYRDSFMQRIHTANGMPTCAWGVAIKIADYVRSLTHRRLTNTRVWFDLTTGPGISAAEGLIKYLQFSDDPEIPWLELDRHVFSFRNGVYLAKEERFILYEVMHRFYAEASYPVACQHFDFDLNPATLYAPDPFIIPTPAVDEFWIAQKLSPNVVRWTLVFIGRLLYNVKEFEDWQIVLFFKGLANTGKSTLLTFIKSIYQPDDVGIIDNAIEKVFGIGMVAGKFLAIMDDIRANFALDQSHFQIMATGGTMSCAVKGKSTLIVDPWTTPVVGSGNVVPDYHDNSGSYGRRMAVVGFNEPVTNPDGTLAQRLKADMPNFIVKCNRFYRNMVRRFPRQGVWNVLPIEFKIHRQELTATSNALIGLLASSDVRKSPNYYVPLRVLCTAVMSYALRNNIAKPQWGPDYFRGPFAIEGLTVSARQKKRYPRLSTNVKKRVDDAYVFGIDLVANMEERASDRPGAAADAIPPAVAAHADDVFGVRAPAPRDIPLYAVPRRSPIVAAAAAPQQQRGPQPILNPRKRARLGPDQ